MELKATYSLLLMCIAFLLTGNEAQKPRLGPVKPKRDTFCPDAPLQFNPSRKGYPRPSCCMSVEEKIPRRALLLVSKCEKQRIYGACHIEALILHIRRGTVCAHPRLLRNLKKIRESQTGLNATRNQ